ncbi:type VI secretion system protein TssA [Uliginosibacterium sediminicola]|uniref:Type VI secretion system protein TssA n=1 Tax=Uliginosibacterium sediminicola TaxID=2024550 RepID=A0ABU9Z112_9RHOO
MSLDTLLSVSQLLAPISEHTASGEDLSFSEDFDRLQEARREDDPSLDQGEWITQIKEADWPFILNHCQNLLQNRSKDLRIALWYCEAAAKLHGLTGFQYGVQLSSGLLETFWESLHPLPEDGDQEQRIGNLSLFIKRSIELVRGLPLVKGKGRSYGLLELEAARLRQAQIDRGLVSAEENSAHISLQQFKDAQKATPRSFYQNLLHGADASKEALGRLSDITDQRLGLDGPSFTALRAALDDYLDTLARLARENGVIDTSEDIQPADEGADAPAADAISPAGNDHGNGGGPIRTREQALRQLRVVAEFFRKTEPHSPVAYLADKAANWGEMPLHVWLKAVLKEDGAFSRFEDLLGLADLPEEP